ncbi:TetR family transcriptional regulator [Comamonas serinivorans]|uniref:TetR family transcriptional regulator n=1 Tax=Comamonas serinivorans TaxID=1082851 RepID=A0A1Y0ES34_9BURK|nr:TetR/AcrR family transcriptional regulator [Comamonas serinivorans]ARU06062.1 TetR family transcriptional regulator [Comamonas serinivorans]
MTSPRPDVAARRAQLLDAAAHVFAEHGITAPLDLVVEHAGLGRATLYRHFPDRTALVAGLMARTADALEARASQLRGRGDALHLMLRQIADGIVHSPALVDYWRGANRDEPELATQRQRVLAALQLALDDAMAQGVCRADLTAQDVTLAAGMLGAALRGRTQAERARLAERAIALLWHGLQAPEGTASC